MRPSDIPYDVGFHFDENLREVSDSPADMQRAVTFLEDRLSVANDDEAGDILGLLGVYSRILGDLEAAERYLTRAVDLTRVQGKPRAVVANELRLAHVFQWQRSFAKADQLYEDVIHRCVRDADLGVYLDFAWQHYGKSLFDQGRYDEAAECFEHALDIRLPAGNQDLIASTRLALDRTNALRR